MPLLQGHSVVIPHDDLFHFVSQEPVHAASWLACALSSGAQQAIDWSSLERAPEKLRGQPLRLSIVDVVFRAQRRSDRSPVWFVIEHKASEDRDVESQMFRYAVHLGERERGERARAAVVGVVLYHGARPFRRRPRAVDDPFAAFAPRLRLVVDDIGQLTEAELMVRPTTPLVTLVHLCLRSLRDQDGEECLQSFERWGELLRAVDRDPRPPRGRAAIAKIASYALTVVEVRPRDLHETFERILQRPEDSIMGTLERTYQKGRSEGRSEGRTEGRTEGRAATILRQLQKRFGVVPDDVVARLVAASEADLERFTDRVLDAATMRDVIDE